MMICEVCHQKNADIVFKTVTGNQVATKAMCMGCAHTMQQDMIKMFMALGFRKDQIDQHEQEAQPKPSMPSYLCTECGRPYHSLDEQTMAGCVSCYEAMREDLKARMESGETAQSDTAKEAEKEAKASAPQNRETKDLRYQLMEAVIREDFEAAAALRDRISSADRGEEPA